MTENEAIKNVTAYVYMECENMPQQVIKALDIMKDATKEIQQYRSIGTVEEFKALKEKAEPKKILYRKQSYGTPWLCPKCEADQTKVEFFSVDGGEPKEKHSYCWNCGTKIDWT